MGKTPSFRLAASRYHRAGLNSHPLNYLRLLYRLPFLPVLFAGYLFGRATGRTGAYRTWIALASRVCGRKLEIAGAAPDPAARLIIANHVSYLDGFPIYYLWPACHLVLTDAVRKWFLIGKLFERSVLFVNKKDPESRKRVRAEMRRIWSEGGSVVVFPEGDWSSEGGRFRPGSFEEAAAAGVMIQGARISYPSSVIASGGRRWKQFFQVLSQNVKIRVHVYPAERAAGDPASLARSWEKRLLSSVG